ncbi:MAG: hypothetical protein HY825_20055 [Acidobacteria bacterium]|nr:hypothetical protein [Acidobacteriota bacterium]
MKTRKRTARFTDGSGGSYLLVALGYVATLLAISFAMADAGTRIIISLQLDTPLRFSLTLTLQILVALSLAFLAAVAVSAAGAAVRWARGRAGGAWQGLTPDAVAVALLLAGGYIGYAPREIYEGPSRHARVEIRRTSLLETPLGIGPNSRGVNPLIVLFRSGDQAIAQLAFTFTDVPQRTWSVRWSEHGSRAIVLFESLDMCLLLPQGVTWSNLCPDEDVMSGFLREEPIEELRRRFGESAPGQEEGEGDHQLKVSAPALVMAGARNRSSMEIPTEGAPS